jgi:glutathione S-transferase
VSIPSHDGRNSNQPLQYYKRDKSTRLAPKELLEVHPLGKSPVITDNGVTIAESGAIVEYLLEKYDTTHRFSPSGTPIIAGDKEIANPKLSNLYYTHFSEGSLMPYLANIRMFTVVPQRMPWFLRWLLKFVFNKILDRVVIPNVLNAAKLVSRALVHIQSTKIEECVY